MSYQHDRQTDKFSALYIQMLAEQDQFEAFKNNRIEYGIMEILLLTKKTRCRQRTGNRKIYLEWPK